MGYCTSPSDPNFFIVHSPTVDKRAEFGAESYGQIHHQNETGRIAVCRQDEESVGREKEDGRQSVEEEGRTTAEVNVGVAHEDNDQKVGFSETYFYSISRHLSVAPLKIKRPVVKPIPKPLPTPLPSVPVPSSPMSPPLPSPIVLSDRRVSEGMPVLRRQIKAPVLHDGTVVTSQVGGVNKKVGRLIY